MRKKTRLKSFIEISLAIIAIIGLIFIYVDQNSEISDLNIQVRELQREVDEQQRENDHLFELLIVKTSQGAISQTELEEYLTRQQTEIIIEKAGIVIIAKLPFYLETQFTPSGWMGDGEQGTNYLSLNTVTKNVNGLEKVVTQFEYRPGDKGWAGIYWQYPDSNWGNKPGKSLVGAKIITFFARGQNGDEIVEFKSGGIRGNQYEDTYEVSIGKLKLSSTWQQYTIDLTNQDLSNVIGAFAWIVTALDNGNSSVIFYVTDIVVDK